MPELGVLAVLLIAAIAGGVGILVGIIVGRRIDDRLQRAEDEDDGDG